MKNLYKISSFLLVLSLVILPTAPAFAQLGDPPVGEASVSAPTVEAPPAPEPAPAPVVESAPVVEPAPEAAPTTEGLEPEVPTTVEVSAPSSQTGPEVSVGTESGVTITDTTAPTISSVADLSLGLSEATIVWTTDELATSRLEYGTTQSYGQNATLNATALLAHTAIILNLTPNTTYYYCIHATDLAGNTRNSCGHSFATAAPSSDGGGTSIVVDTTPPDISLVTVTSISPDSVTINWTTDSVANAEVEYGTNAGYGEVTPLNTSLALNHSVTLTGLTPNTEYHYRIRSADEIGNTATTPDNTFTTTQTTSQSVTTSGDLNISAIETASITTSAVTITWQTNLPADSQIEYGDSENLGSLTTLDSTLSTSHSVTIPNLSPNTNYIYRIKSKPAGALAATVSNFHEFSTLSHSTPIVAPANITSVATSGVTTSGSTITWTTDKGATSQVEYGLNTSYGEQSSFSSSLITPHSISLANLDPGTTYHYRVKSVDEVGNITFSDDHTFTTTAPSTPLSAPATLSTLVIGGYDQFSVDLTWHTTSENTDISYEYDIRYSTSPITEGNYGNTTEAQLTPVYHSDLDPEGTERNYIVAGLSQSTTYYFAVKSKHQTSVWSAVSNVVSGKTTAGASVNNESAHTSASVGSSQSSAGGGGSNHVRQEYGSGSGGNAAFSFEPTTLKTEPADNQIIFEWNNPGEENFVRTVVVRKEGSYPSSPSDGQTIYEGRGETFTDTNVTNGKTYYYALYSYNHSKTYSAPVRVSLAPKAGNHEIKFNESGSLVSVLPIMHFVHSHKKGDKDIEVEHLQEVLVLENVSFPENLITGYFGSITENALKKFQAKHGLAVTGIVDTATQEKLNTVSQAETRLSIPGDFVVFSTDMKFGDRGEAVKDLQEFLVYEGSYTQALVSGYFGNLTRSAVMKFQRKYSISPVSGYVGYKTRHRMQQLTGF